MSYPGDDFAVHQRTDSGVIRLEVVGELDLASAPAFGEHVEAALDGAAGAIVVDVSRASFVDSTGLAALLRAKHQATAAGCTLRVDAPDGSEARVVMELSGLGSRLLVD